eukprot:TRINITY_DN71_c1_g1_i1.p1 TRINITY_DN71_c1_g1~~TRINITY_DN71_c1_g1_i1.p1  ORF type:complete len:580 (+),score=146.05 TRINITY_DN71_c1_g1_i1:41-1741(+)
MYKFISRSQRALSTLSRVSAPENFSVHKSSVLPLKVKCASLQQAKQTKPETVTVFATHEESAKLNELTQGLLPSLPSSALSDFSKSKKGAVQFLYPTQGSLSRICLVSLGKGSALLKKETNKWEWPRDAIHHAITALRARKCESTSVLLPFASLSPSSSSPSFSSSSASLSPLHVPSRIDLLDIMTRTAVMSNYDFDKYKKESDRVSSMKELQWICADQAEAQSPLLEKRLMKAQVYAAATIFARELANERADVATPLYMESVARSVCQAHELTFTLLQDTQLQQLGLDMIHAVGKAASHLPRIITMEYNGNPKQKERIALVGKGITFDSGGLNIKTGDYMDDMHLDMSGSAAVLATMKAIATLKLPINVVGVLALAENAVGPTAYKPKTIISTPKGTVEVSNTDAEGRLVLADAFTYTQKTFCCSHMIDLATLTGACRNALGEQLAGLFSNDDTLASQLIESGERANERCWKLPITSDHIADITKTDYSDFRSTGASKTAGACTAAAFLKQFVEENVKWSHIDIAGTAMYSHARSYKPVGGTGFGVQLLCDFLDSQASGDVDISG